MILVLNKKENFTRVPTSELFYCLKKVKEDVLLPLFSLFGVLAIPLVCFGG